MSHLRKTVYSIILKHLSSSFCTFLHTVCMYHKTKVMRMLSMLLIFKDEVVFKLHITRTKYNSLKQNSKEIVKPSNQFTLYLHTYMICHEQAICYLNGVFPTFFYCEI